MQICQLLLLLSPIKTVNLYGIKINNSNNNNNNNNNNKFAGYM